MDGVDLEAEDVVTEVTEVGADTTTAEVTIPRDTTIIEDTTTTKDTIIIKDTITTKDTTKPKDTTMTTKATTMTAEATTIITQDTTAEDIIINVEIEGQGDNQDPTTIRIISISQLMLFWTSWVQKNLLRPC